MPRRFQFRLSTLLWITLAVAGWFGGRQFQYREDERLRLEWQKHKQNWVVESEEDFRRRNDGMLIMKQKMLDDADSDYPPVPSK